MEIKPSYNNDIIILKLKGELDMATIDILVSKVKEVKGDYNKIIFDFSGIEFIDSTGVGHLIKLFQDSKDLKYVLTNLQEDVEEVFEILNLSEILGEEVFVDSNQGGIEFLNDK